MPRATTAPKTSARAARAERTRDRALEEIARSILGIETLAERKRDALDFHDIGVWSLKEALAAAYELGARAAAAAAAD